MTPALSDSTLEAGLDKYLREAACLSALVANRIYPGRIARQNSTFPAIAYKVVGVEQATVLDGSAGVADATIELESWSTLFADVVTVAAALRDLLTGFGGGWWGCVGVADVEVIDWSDDEEDPKDGSGNVWFCRTLVVAVKFYQPIPRF
ncbi:MAG: DUF3168 domain-containing protein [Planctomycetes bacterium]|nr:DUF3168 domain-containing protein [Planctomycetota bacterium]